MVQDDKTFLLHLTADDCQRFAHHLSAQMNEHGLSPEAMAAVVAAYIRDLRKSSSADRQRLNGVKVGAFMLRCYASNRMKPSHLHARIIAEALGKTLPEMLA